MYICICIYICIYIYTIKDNEDSIQERRVARVLIQEMELEYNAKSSILEREGNVHSSNMLLSLAVHSVDVVLIM